MFISIDPGNFQSAYVHLHCGHIARFGIIPNDELLAHIKENHGQSQICLEMVQSFGMSVGKEVFDTVFWIGRYFQASCVPAHLLYRIDVKNHLCHSSKANDGNIRQAIIDRYGGKDRAIGKKAAPGPLFGVSKDIWAALAVGLTWQDKNKLG